MQKTKDGVAQGLQVSAELGYYVGLGKMREQRETRGIQRYGQKLCVTAKMFQLLPMDFFKLHHFIQLCGTAAELQLCVERCSHLK